MTKKLFVGQSAFANGLLDLIHMDVCGSLNTPARGGFSYFITFTDDHSRYGYVYLMRYKSEAFRRFKEYRLEVENQTGHKIKALRSDRGEEYLVPTDGAPVLGRSTRESRPPKRYGFIGLTRSKDIRRSDVGHDSDKWLEAMKSEMDSMDSNQVWTLVDPSKGGKPVKCKWVYKHKLELMAKLQPSRLGL
ncbi:hypothetical protein Sango_0263800 [Sesamum angolense]|uniref:Uncharacterized protein n=1 Tax=Sesamum angolense TaxID=2727404 RepID=A0AAE1XHI0_9LAMI|nr:hypothetical protein Sango_0263800 [Sesamum angolense]